MTDTTNTKNNNNLKITNTNNNTKNNNNLNSNKNNDNLNIKNITITKNNTSRNIKTFLENRENSEIKRDNSHSIKKNPERKITEFIEPSDNQNKLYSFLLGGNNTIFFCPDKPIFKINKLSDIKLLTSSYKNYTFQIVGTLYNPYRIINGQFDKMDNLISDIDFHLIISDKLIEESENKKSNVSCLLKKDSPFNQIEKVTILCVGAKKYKGFAQNQNVDIILNWDLIENKKHKNLIIIWPNERKHYKNLYSYTLQGLSLMQKNYGCFNNQFYFFIFIYDLGAEPHINFDLEMKSPTFPKANCQLYDSITLKCYLPLFNKKMLKGEYIRFPINVEYSNINSEGNRVVFKVSNYSREYDDFHILMKEDCGDFAMIGALKNVGLSFFSIVLWIIGVLAFILFVLVCIVFFIYYKIKYRGRKGKYFAYVEEDNAGKTGQKI